MINDFSAGDDTVFEDELFVNIFDGDDDAIKNKIHDIIDTFIDDENKALYADSDQCKYDLISLIDQYKDMLLDIIFN